MLAAAALMLGLLIPGGPAAAPAGLRDAHGPTLLLRVRAEQALRARARPRARTLDWIGARTIYDRPSVLSVTRVQGRWAQVLSDLVPNGKRAWVRLDDPAVALRWTRMSARADLSRRTLDVFRDQRLVRSVPVAIGRAGTPTPLGRFAITDKLDGAAFGSAYGCCILALTGHQPRVRVDGIDGRMAIHGTDRPAGVGQRDSLGCLHTTDRNMRWLRDTLPVGTTVTIVA
jgi:hypothetical protein